MKIYHYTSIETLGLILESQKIRFSRLDTVDDPEEYGFTFEGHEPAKHVFISCWSKNQYESIPQWLIYGNKKHGVRIEVDDNLFDIDQTERYTQLTASKEFWNKGIILLPFTSAGFLQDLVYVDAPKDYYSNIFQNINNETAVDYKEIGLYKSKDWKFQKECRFKIYAGPKELLGDPIATLNYIVNNDKYLTNTYIDIPVKKDAFEGMSITLGPEISKAEEIIVQSICNKYLTKYEIHKSIFSNKYVINS